MNKIQLLLVVILFQLSCSRLDDANEQPHAVQTLKELTGPLKMQGWEEISIPSAPDPVDGVVVENELLRGVQLNQKVSLKFPWVVIHSVRVPPNTEREVALGFISHDQRRGSLKIVDPSGCSQTMTIRKQQDEPSRGGVVIGWKVKSLGNEELLIVGLQRCVEVYDSNAKLIAKGYESSFTTAILERVNKKETEKR